jgi:hypothetical protein
MAQPTRSELQAIVNSGTPAHRERAQSLLDTMNGTYGAGTPLNSDGLLVALRKKALSRFTASKDTRSIEELKHNWPSYKTDGKVLGEGD